MPNVKIMGRINLETGEVTHVVDAKGDLLPVHTCEQLITPYSPNYNSFEWENWDDMPLFI